MPADLPVAAPDHAETIRRFANDTDPTGEVVAALAALLAERQQDKARIERLEKALREIMVEETFPVDNEHGSINVFVADDVCDLARAALAVEEDARPSERAQRRVPRQRRLARTLERPDLSR